MNTTTKQKRQPSPAQQLKKELKQQYPLLVISCTYDSYSMGASIHVDIKNLHFTPYSLSEIEQYCNQYSKVRKDEYGDILSGGNTFVMVNNRIDDNIKAELDQMFISYLSIYKDYENIKTVEYNILIELPSKHRETYRKLLDNQSYCELPTPPVEIAETIETITPEETSQETTPETKIEMNKIDQIIDTLNANDTVYHYEYQQGKKYLKIYYSMILNDGTIRENNKSILYFYEPETNLLYKANSWKQKGNILMSGNEFLTRNTYATDTTAEETPQETTTEKQTNQETELKLNNEIEQQINELNDKLTARNNLLIYLEKNNINGKIQQATEEEINEIKTEIEELTAKLDPRPKLKQQIAETKDLINRNAQDIINHTAPEEIAFFANDILILNNELSQLIKQLEEAEAKAEIKEAINSDFSQEDKQDFIETKTAELVLTAPPTMNPQNVIELFPRRKTLDQLRKDLNTPEQYQDLINNFDSYCKQYDNLTLHGLQLIRDDYSTKDANGELSPTYDQWFKFMQSYEELTNELRKKN